VKEQGTLWLLQNTQPSPLGDGTHLHRRFLQTSQLCTERFLDSSGIRRRRRLVADGGGAAAVGAVFEPESTLAMTGSLSTEHRRAAYSIVGVWINSVTKPRTGTI
jgi:hypothetical protein